MAVDFLAIPVFLQQTTEHTQSADPKDLSGQTSLAGTTALTVAGVATLGLGLSGGTGTRARVNLSRLADNETILDQLPHVLACNKMKEGGAK